MLDENNHHRVVFVTMTEIRSMDKRLLYCLERESLRGYDFSGKNLQLADLRGFDLEGCSFRGSDLSGARFDDAVLRRCDFSGSYMIGCRFDGSDLTGSTGLDCVRNRCFVEGNPKQESHFYRASWKRCNFTGIDLEWVDPRALHGGWTSFFEGCTGIDVSRRKVAHTLFI